FADGIAETNRVVLDHVGTGIGRAGLDDAVELLFRFCAGTTGTAEQRGPSDGVVAGRGDVQRTGGEAAFAAQPDAPLGIAQGGGDFFAARGRAVARRGEAG